MTPPFDRFISVVVPARNAAAYLQQFINELSAILSENYNDHEIIVVDDASDDSTAEVINQLLSETAAMRVLFLSRPHGNEVAVSVGIASAIGDYVVVINPNSDPVGVIPQLVRLAIAGADVIYGVDPSPSKRSYAHRLLSKFFHWYIDRFLNISIPADLTTLRCFSRHSVNALSRIDGAHQYYRYLGSVIGFKSQTFQYQRNYLDKSTEKQSLGKAISEGVQIITENSPHPLRVVSLLGILFAMANVAYVGYIVAIYLFKPDVLPGWTTLSLQVAGLTLAVILILSALSEYVGRILQRVQNRPSFFIREERNSMVKTAARMNIARDSAAVQLHREVR